MKKFIFVFATVLLSYSNAFTQDTFSSRHFKPALLKLELTEQIAIMAKHVPCLRAALMSVQTSILARSKFDRPTVVREFLHFHTFSGDMISLTVQSPINAPAPLITHHWLIPVARETSPLNCTAGKASLNIYDNEMGGGGVSIHN